MIIDIEYVMDIGLDDDLYNLCQNEPAKVEKYIKNIDMMIFSYIDREQFKKADGTYEYPSDLKFFAERLLESLYIYQIKGGNSLAGGNITAKSESISDYSTSESRSFENKNALSLFGIPIYEQLYHIIQKYTSEDTSS
jgi:hypothetical protein